MDLRLSTPGVRPVLTLIFTAAVTGCASGDFPDDRARAGVDPAAPRAELEADGPVEPRSVGDRITARLFGPDAPALQAAKADSTNANEEVRRATACPRMPTAGLGPTRTRRPFDMDSIRKLPEDVADSLASENALPRTDGEVIPLYRRSGVEYRMPVVRLDSAGHPIRVVPLCRRTGR